MNDTHNYEVNLQWVSDRKGTLSSSVLPQKIEVATPPDFPNGIPGIWSPEHLFVAAVNACLMTTFLAIAENSKLEYISYECNAVGIVEKVDGKFQVTEITLKPVLTISESVKTDRAERILKLSEDNCLISNSVKSTINFQPRIIVL